MKEKGYPEKARKLRRPLGKDCPGGQSIVLISHLYVKVLEGKLKIEITTRNHGFPFHFQNNLTIPNLITLVRILLTPLFIIFLIQGPYHKALIIFVLAGVSDLADGIIARTWQQKSRLGSYLDPLADKASHVRQFRYPEHLP